ncbi:MAG: RNA-binding S4 domain-containing protein [Candidatus Azotimanducaceae bacterium WSBS_2022_MAG_OTU7]
MTMPEIDVDQNAPTDARVVEINQEPVELYKILKFEGMVASGGEGKAVIVAGQVQVNGKVETRKRKKIVAGDTVTFNTETIAIRLLSNVSAAGLPAKTDAEPVVAGQTTEAINSRSAAMDVATKL